MSNWLRRRWKHDPGLDVAEKANQRASAERDIVDSRWPEIRKLAQDLESLRSENNFGARIRAAYQESR